MDLILEADPKQQRRRRSRRSGLVRLHRRAHRPPLPTILLANVQSLDNKVDEIRATVASRDTSEIVTFSVSQKHGSLGICFRDRFSQQASPCIAPTEINTSLGRGWAGVYAYDYTMSR